MQRVSSQAAEGGFWCKISFQLAQVVASALAEPAEPSQSNLLSTMHEPVSSKAS